LRAESDLRPFMAMPKFSWITEEKSIGLYL